MFWNKKKIIGDTVEKIYLNEEGTRYYPLQCDHELYAKGLEIVKRHLQSWMVQDITIAGNTNQAIDTTLLYQLKEIDVKFLPYAEQQNILTACLRDNEISFSGSRLMDTFLRINVEVPIEVLETIKGKFLYGMVYGLPETISDVPIPKKEQWINTMRLFPWCHFLMFIQEIYDTDDIIKRIDALTTKIKAGNTTTVVSTTPMGGGSTSSSV